MTPRRRRMLLAIRALEPVSIAVLIRATHLPRIVVLGTIQDLRDRHLATRTGRAEYRLTDRGRHVAGELLAVPALFH